MTTEKSPTERTDAAVVDALAVLDREGHRSPRARGMVRHAAEVARAEGLAAGRREAVVLATIAGATAASLLAVIALAIVMLRG